MAARKNLTHDEETRKKIQVSQLINRLAQNAFSDVDIMSAGQIKSAEILLRKALPDLATMTLKGDADNPLEVNHHDQTHKAILDHYFKNHFKQEKK